MGLDVVCFFVVHLEIRMLSGNKDSNIGKMMWSSQVLVSMMQCFLHLSISLAAFNPVICRRKEVLFVDCVESSRCKSANNTIWERYLVANRADEPMKKHYILVGEVVNFVRSTTQIFNR